MSAEFYMKCVDSQRVFVDAIPWATAQADQSRAALAPKKSPAVPRPWEGPESLLRQTSNPFIDLGQETTNRNGVAVNEDERETATHQIETEEEKLLGKLLQANTDLIEAFKMHDGEALSLDSEWSIANLSLDDFLLDIVRQKNQTLEQRAVEERSRVETRFDRSVCQI
jgi:hypothetical protein